jgi:hypothetical protein
MATITTQEPGDVRLMTLDEIEAELTRLDERRRLLMRARRFVIELNTERPGNGRPREGRSDV